MPRIKQSFVRMLKERADIVAIAGRFTQLTSRGSESWGRCPFHKEKSASFKVNPDRGQFKCFGCGKHGDAVDLVKDLDAVSFRDAVEFVANQSNIQIEFEDGSDNRQERSIRGQLFEAHEIAQNYFREKINEMGNPESSAVRTYVRRVRGFTVETARERGFGFAPTQDDGVLWNRIAEKFGPEIAEQTGMFFKPRNGVARLRWSGRLMIPIYDRQQRLCAFTGRVIPNIKDETTAWAATRPTQNKSSGEAKYVNSPNTPIFDKGSMLFNWNQAWKNPPTTEHGRLLLVEGQLDAIRTAEVSIPHVVAPQGTSITEEQVKLLASYPAGVLCLLDGDSAGRKGAMRLIQLGVKQALDMRFTVLADDEDPDSLFKDKSPEDAAQILLELHERSMSPMLMAISTFLHENEDNPANKQAITDTVIGWLVDANQHTQAYDYLSELARCLKVDINATWLDYRKRIGVHDAPENAMKGPPIHPLDVIDVFDKAQRLLRENISLEVLSPEEKTFVIAAETPAKVDLTQEVYAALTKTAVTYKKILDYRAEFTNQEAERLTRILEACHEALDRPKRSLEFTGAVAEAIAEVQGA